MAPEAKAERGTRPNVIRATPVQTEILKNAFAMSNTTTPEQLKALSLATNLPERWIYQWFGRQRGKDRKVKSKAAGSSLGGPSGHTESTPVSAPGADLSASTSASSVASATMLITSTPDTALSPQEILQIKQEYHDAVPSSWLSGSLVASNPASLPLYHPASQEISTLCNASMLSSGALENPPAAASVSTSRPKRRGRTTQAVAENQIPSVSDSQKMPAAQKRGKRRGATRAARVKAEFVEPSVETFTAASSRQVVLDLSGEHTMPTDLVNTDTDRNAFSAMRPPAANHVHFLPNIGPPRRSSVSAPKRSRGSGLPVPQSAPLLKNRSGHALHLPQQSHTDVLNPRSGSSRRTRNTATRNPSQFQGSENVSSPALTAQSEGHGTVFRAAQFHNQGPSHYMSPLASSRTTTGVAGGRARTDVCTAADVTEPTASPLQYLYEWPSSNVVPCLAPAFDWESHVPSEPGLSISSVARELISQYQQSPGIRPAAFGVDNHRSHAEIQQTIPVDTAVESSSGSFVYPQLDLSGIGNFLVGTVLDPSLAPLKHLTEVLKNFRDVEGTYMPLMEDEQRARLMNCLLDEKLAEQSPFQAAMGLSLLSKLGVEWEV